MERERETEGERERERIINMKQHVYKMKQVLTGTLKSVRASVPTLKNELTTRGIP